MRFPRSAMALAVLCTAGLVVAASGVLLPQEVHPAFARSISNAESASSSGNNQKALALLKGVVYPEGVTVKIDESSIPDGRRNEAYNATAASIKTWQAVLSGDSPLQFVGANEEADIVIQFTNSIPADSADCLGLIQLKKEYRWNNWQHELGVSGTIHVMKSFNGKPLKYEEWNEVICHELGHLLGLDDVTENGKLMGPLRFGKPVLAPATNEVDAVKTLRQAARQRIIQIEKSLRQENETPLSALLDSTEFQQLHGCSL
ncbi:MAG: matrixin family metalloprotease [Armatimonadetes bacterium]|nr:matrixin family metalloprotease [Armatimonadota bacterium]